MQIHIHKDGKTHGPYSIEQVRQYLKAGNLKPLTLAQGGAQIGKFQKKQKIIIDLERAK